MSRPFIAAGYARDGSSVSPPPIRADWWSGCRARDRGIACPLAWPARRCRFRGDKGRGPDGVPGPATRATRTFWRPLPARQPRSPTSKRVRGMLRVLGRTVSRLLGAKTFLLIAPLLLLTTGIS